MGFRILPIAGAAAVAAAVAAALIGIGDPAAVCLPIGCDCESVGSGLIRQPWNAWSSLGLAAVGIWILDRGGPNQYRSFTGFAAVGAGIAAFWMHSALTGWSARLDGIGVAGLTAALALAAWSDRVRGRTAPAAAVAVIATGAAAGAPALQALTLLSGAIAASGLWRRRRAAGRGPVLGATALIAGGGLAWWLGRSGGLWCAPDGFIVHAVWHLAAAAAVAVAWVHVRRCTP